MIKNLNAADLENFIKSHNEKDYLIVDVRLNEEYALDHIPGSINVPLAFIHSGQEIFDGHKKLIFYCRSGRRSKVAAIFASEIGYEENKLYHLTGGVLDYTGEILLEYPKIDVFPSNGSTIDLMKKSIDLEKGAFVFYSYVQKIFDIKPLCDVMTKMAQAEVSHARSIFNALNREFKFATGFDEFFDSCEGLILEGGKSIEQVKAFLEITPSVSCIDILDFAVELEFCAYDLYKVMAVSVKEEKLQEMFYALAQAEKKHLEQIIHAFELCDIKT